MRELHHAIFPEIVNLRWSEIDLNQEAIKRKADSLVPPEKQIEFVSRVHKEHNCSCSYGGYLEDRSILWQGHYQSPENMIHLGMDFNVPAKTPVRLPFFGKVVFAIHDKDMSGGWGGRVDFFNEEGQFYFILGHLGQDAELHTKGFMFGKGCVVGFVGSHHENGGWFPHLHLQIVSKEEYEKHPDPMKIDGYGGGSTDDLRARFPDPHVAHATDCLSLN